MFLHVSVSLSVHGVCAIPTCIAGGIPQCLATGGSAWGVCSSGSAPRGVPALEGVVETPQKQMATVADGMHPTGMHSCGRCIASLKNHYCHPQKCLQSNSILTGSLQIVGEMQGYMLTNTT